MLHQENKEAVLETINEGRSGLFQIVSNPYYRELIDRYSFDKEAKERIDMVGFEDHHPYFWMKRSDAMEPSQYLQRFLHGVEDESTIKWFLLLYAISSASDLYKDKIHKYLDDNVSSAWAVERANHHYCFDLYYVRKELENNIINVQSIIKNFFPKESSLICSEAVIPLPITQIALTAGFHYLHDVETVPNALREMDVDLPFILSEALYVSMIKGKGFYEVLGNIFEERGLKERLGDVMIMVEKNRTIEVLRTRNEILQSQIRSNNEEIRKQETAGDIIAENFEKKIRLDDLVKRIQKCNGKEHRDLLYKLESLCGRRLSFLTPLNQITSLPQSRRDSFLREMGLFLSEKENQEITTVEHFVDAIISHQQFIRDYKKAVLQDDSFEPIPEDSSYDLETRIKEIESIFGVKVDKGEVQSLAGLRRSVLDNDPVLKEIVESLVDCLGVAPEDIRLDSDLVSDFGADSLDFVELLMTAEQKYGIRIPENETSNIRTVEDIYSIVSNQVRKKENQ